MRGGQGGGQGGGRGQGGGQGSRRGQGGGQGSGRGLNAGPGIGGECVCPACGARVAHKRGAPCVQTPCPNCGTIMQRG